MGKVKLGSVCTIVSGSTPKSSCPEYWGGSIKWVTPAEISDETHYIEDTERHITEEGMRSCHLRMMPLGTVLLSSRAPIGKTAITKSPMCCNQGFKNLICSNSISNEYLYHFLNAKTDELKSIGRGATFKEISKKQVESITIDLPALDEQDRRITVLNQIESLLKRSHDSKNRIDDLVKSRFVEMFGDLRENREGWPVEQFDSFAIIDTHMITDLDSYAEKPHIGIDSIESISGRLSGYRTVAEDGIVSGKYPFTNAHIIYSKIRPALNKVALPDFDGVCSADAYPILPVAEKCNRVYLAHVLRSDFFLDHVLPLSGRAQMPKVNKKALRAFSMPLPPLTLQQEFADFVSQVDKLRFAIQQQIDKLETLKNSLMQEYFE